MSNPYALGSWISTSVIGAARRSMVPSPQSAMRPIWARSRTTTYRPILEVLGAAGPPGGLKRPVDTRDLPLGRDVKCRIQSAWQEAVSAAHFGTAPDPRHLRGSRSCPVAVRRSRLQFLRKALQPDTDQQGLRQLPAIRHPASNGLSLSLGTPRVTASQLSVADR